MNNDWYIFTVSDSEFGFYLFNLIAGEEFGWEVPNSKSAIYGPAERKRSYDQNDYFRVKDVRRSVAFFNSEVFDALRFNY